ncbi:Response regulator receiver domain-containing protein [Paenibacillus sp. 1_12]|uniref:response regulator n=1 Tax=Paenibacillus sp. 1_12 TaxID=1566278 RepID=UPI0008EF032E|nr:response regulator [Paenibacillus sp. 1_12]SFL07387.1 Response regulator receiver domain-containing protein [Paenibacillus sp. 1_12]
MAQSNFEFDLLDLMMPHMDGWQVCNENRQSEDIQIIMLTARGEEQDRLIGLMMGAYDYLIKSFSPRSVPRRSVSLVKLGITP